MIFHGMFSTTFHYLFFCLTFYNIVAFKPCFTTCNCFHINS